MAEDFGLLQLVEYLAQMGLRTAIVDYEQAIIELAFHGNQGQWRLILSIQQSGEARKLLVIVPHIGMIGKKKRLECLEALMAVNYRIAVGKFGLDLDDGEIRLEEAIPLAGDSITFTQFRIVISAIMQSISMYHSLLPRIIYGNLSALDALEACEQDFLREIEPPDEAQTVVDSENVEAAPNLNVHDVLAEITRLFEENKD